MRGLFGAAYQNGWWMMSVSVRDGGESMAKDKFNWTKVHNAADAIAELCNRMKRKPDGTGCTHYELIEALNNVRGTLESEIRRSERE